MPSDSVTQFTPTFIGSIILTREIPKTRKVTVLEARLEVQAYFNKLKEWYRLQKNYVLASSSARAKGESILERKTIKK